MTTVALFGQCATGKSTLARLVSGELGIPLRACGDVVRERARELGVALDMVPMSEHAAIDHATVEWVLGQEQCIVEGRYLDFVLRPVADRITLIRLTASSQARLERLRKSTGRSMKAQASALLQASDDADRQLTERLYAGDPTVPHATLHTSAVSIEITHCILNCFLQIDKQPA